MTTATHTPTPWKVNYAQEINGTFKAEILPGMNEHQAVAYTWGATLDQTLSNAAFIVRAVNSHEHLVEALKGLFDMVRDGKLVRDIAGDAKPDWALSSMELVMKLSKAQQAIAEAEGK